ncbi:hypothetical protein SmJEL517_g04485 [Synchytrium microbalum]|uniref:1-phosphatidylinositol-4-phosphate 5-kinase n=1 Tax=Synchytrium microbalum TaxID=1806994 RepID=A0A507C091_9FUNG|nr:uncharacterized protein SmJEL517_g04485 [Synchytrium microbalum]TPX32469.1 hypothetical protein SmJEL517_g04485 [Synchytrium microbalum]
MAVINGDENNNTESLSSGIEKKTMDDIRQGDLLDGDAARAPIVDALASTPKVSFKPLTSALEPILPLNDATRTVPSSKPSKDQLNSHPTSPDTLLVDSPESIGINANQLPIRQNVASGIIPGQAKKRPSSVGSAALVVSATAGPSDGPNRRVSHSANNTKGTSIQSPATHLLTPEDDSKKWKGVKRSNTVGSESGGTMDGAMIAAPPSASDARRRPLSRARSEKEVLVGTPVKEGHPNYMLMYNMLTGIRISVSRCNAKAWRDLTAVDFSAAHKLAFDVTGNELTPSSKYDFKFKDYAPWVFRATRDIFHVDPAEYLMSVTGKYVLSELGSPGKSGSFFYYTQDYRFIIKTIHHSEHKFMRKALRAYYEHVRNNPHTLMSRIFGLHRVKLPGNRKIHFVVMGNVFPPNKDIHEVYDLKGSTVGRIVPDDVVKRNPSAVMKDLNFLQRGQKIKLGPAKSLMLIEQITKDVQFLVAMKIMDYSLLIGLHDLIKGNKDNIRDTTLTVFEPNADTIARTQQKRSSKANAIRRALADAEPTQLGPSETRLPDEAPPERRYCVFYQDQGGFQATDESNQPIEEIYYLGIIDIFTKYDAVKRIEHTFKSITHDSHQISAVNPIAYGARFLNFMKDAIKNFNESSMAPITPMKMMEMAAAAMVAQQAHQIDFIEINNNLVDNSTQTSEDNNYRRLKIKIEELEELLLDARNVLLDTRKRPESLMAGITPPQTPLPVDEALDGSLSTAAPPPPPMPPPSMFQPQPLIIIKTHSKTGTVRTSGQNNDIMGAVLRELAQRSAQQSAKPRALTTPIAARSENKENENMKTPTSSLRSHIPIPKSRSRGETPHTPSLLKELAGHKLKSTNVPRSPGGTTILPNSRKRRTSFVNWNEVAVSAMRKKFRNAYPKEEEEQAEEGWPDDEDYTPVKSTRKEK